MSAAAHATGRARSSTGRWLSGNAGALLAEIIDMKPAPEDAEPAPEDAGAETEVGTGAAARTGRPRRQFVILDAGMTDLMRPALYGAIHRIVRLEPGSGPAVPCDIVGPVCESSDTFLGDRTLVEPTVGTLVAILDAAPTARRWANYNRRPLARRVCERRRWRVIRRPQSVDDRCVLECP